jgi:hypothetical protein
MENINLHNPNNEISYDSHRAFFDDIYMQELYNYVNSVLARGYSNNKCHDMKLNFYLSENDKKVILNFYNEQGNKIAWIDSYTIVKPNKDGCAPLWLYKKCYKIEHQINKDGCAQCWLYNIVRKRFVIEQFDNIEALIIDRYFP